jgi:hypothetical protein
MNCYICDDRSRAVPAVAICQSCGIALCRDHLDRDLLAAHTQGVTRRGCTHDPIHGARHRQRAGAIATSSPA